MSPPLAASLLISSTNSSCVPLVTPSPLASPAGPVRTLAAISSMATEAAAATVKLQVKLAASPLPAESLAAVVTAASYCVPYESATVGLKVATVPDMVTAPAAAAPPCAVTVKAPFTEVASIDSLKVAVMAALGAAAEDPSAGVTAVTSGGT